MHSTAIGATGWLPIPITKPGQCTAGPWQPRWQQGAHLTGSRPSLAGAWPLPGASLSSWRLPWLKAGDRGVPCSPWELHGRRGALPAEDRLAPSLSCAAGGVMLAAGVRPGRGGSGLLAGALPAEASGRSSVVPGVPVRASTGPALAAAAVVSSQAEPREASPVAAPPGRARSASSPCRRIPSSSLAEWERLRRRCPGPCECPGPGCPALPSAAPRAGDPLLSAPPPLCRASNADRTRKVGRARVLSRLQGGPGRREGMGEREGVQWAAATAHTAAKAT